MSCRVSPTSKNFVTPAVKVYKVPMSALNLPFPQAIIHSGDCGKVGPQPIVIDHFFKVHFVGGR